MPALPSSVIDPLWEQFAALLPERDVVHPLGCHRPRIPDRVVFDKLVQSLVFGAAYERLADPTCSATTIRARRDEWIAAGAFARLEQISLEAYDRIVGLDLAQITVDGCIVKAPCGGEASGRSPVDRGKQSTKRSLMVEGAGIPLGCVIAGAHRNDSPLLRPTLEHLGRFNQGMGMGLPDDITVHLDAGYDSAKTRDLLDELGCSEVVPAPSRQAMGRRTNQLLAQPRRQEARHLHRAPRPRDRGIHRPGQRRHRHPTTPHRSLAHPPLGHPPRPPTMTYPRDL